MVVLLIGLFDYENMEKFEGGILNFIWERFWKMDIVLLLIKRNKIM